MDTLFKIELIVNEAEREESFPMQEQSQGPGRSVCEIPASVVFAERAPGAGRCPEHVEGFGIAAPVFVP